MPPISAIVNRTCYAADMKHISVVIPDELATLLDLARKHRGTSAAAIVRVTSDFALGRRHFSAMRLHRSPAWHLRLD